MNEQIQEAFEAWWDDSHDMIDSSKNYRLSNGSYALPGIASAYRAFKAGAESSFTAVDMATAAADGFRDGVASVVVDIPEVMRTRPFQTIDRGSDNFKAGFNMAIRLSGAAIIAAGGSVKP